jgi:hypothetical protein
MPLESELKCKRRLCAFPALREDRHALFQAVVDILLFKSICKIVDCIRLAGLHLSTAGI